MSEQSNESPVPKPAAAQRPLRPRFPRRPARRPRPPQAAKENQIQAATSEKIPAAANETPISTPSAPPPPVEQKRFSEGTNRGDRVTSVAKAIQEVKEVSSALKEVLDDLENVLEILEEAEHQKNLDEKEIDSLRQAIRQLQRRRENIPVAPQRDRNERDIRENRDQREPRRNWRDRNERTARPAPPKTEEPVATPENEPRDERAD